MPIAWIRGYGLRARVPGKVSIAKILQSAFAEEGTAKVFFYFGANPGFERGFECNMVKRD